MENTISKYKQQKLNGLARKIIEENQYVSLATADPEGIPWISPVAYACDKNWNLYFVSIPTSRHCRNISKKGRCACAIFDSQQAWGTGVGLQIEATTKELTFKETFNAAKYYISRRYHYGNPDPKTVINFVQRFIAEKKMYRFYKITPEVVWINNPYSDTDIRVKVDLKN